MEHAHPENPELNYDYIVDGIYIGTNQCCVLGLVEVLKREGITADISLEEDRLDAPFGVDAYIWIPVLDERAPTYDQLSFGVASIEKLVSQGRKIYVHCKNGHGRAPTFVAAHLIRKGYKLEDAIELIKSKRPSMHLHEPQKKLLEEYYANINKM